MDKKRDGVTAEASASGDVVEALCDLINASQRLQLRLSDDERMSPLDVSDWLLLREVGKGADLPLAALAVRLGVTRQHIQKQVVGLSRPRPGLLTVTVSGTQKRRRTVQLSELGRKKVAELDLLVRDKLVEGGKIPSGEQIVRAARISRRLAVTWQRSDRESAQAAAPAAGA